MSPQSLLEKVAGKLIGYLVSSFEDNGEVPILKALSMGDQNVALADTYVSKEEVVTQAEELVDSESPGPDGTRLQVQRE